MKLSISVSNERIEAPYDNIPEFFADICKKNADRLAILYNEKKYTYKELYYQVAKFTKVLQDLGIKKNDKVVMLLGNSLDFPIAFFGILNAGAVAIPLITLLKTNEIIRIIKQSEVKAMIVADALSSTIRKIVKKELIPTIITQGSKSIKGTLSLKELMEKSNPDFQHIDDLKRNDIATINYTSGTTGFPKGVVHSHSNYLFTAVAQLKATELPKDGVIIMCLPLYHAYGLTVTVSTLLNGSALDIIPRFHPVIVLDALADKAKRYPPNYEIGSTFVPAMIHMMLDVIDKNPEYIELINNSKFGAAVVGAAPISRVDLNKWTQLFPDKVLTEGIASTEDCVYGSVNPRRGPIKFGSVGRVFPGSKMAVVDEDGNILPINTRGELVVQNEGIMLEYYKNPEKTKEVLKPVKGQEGIWYYMGDIALMDEDEYFWIVDRKKDLVIVGGRNVFPRDIEELLVKHPKVNEACIIGEPDQALGEVVRALIVPEKNVDIDKQEIIKYMKENLAEYMIPRPEHVEFLPMLKKTATGKVLKKDYRVSYEEIRAGKKE
ncbi:MAG: class I adenylate-forming enzyme family protein [Candidatus Helarchaeota archaeon]